jgi:tetratricopeptide (TPR) repeat protein
MLEAAVRLLRAGQLAEAAKAYREILDRDPQHAESLHHLGVIATLLGRLDRAVDLIGKALALNDRNHEAHRNIGLAHHLRGHQQAALSHFQQAIRLAPNYVDAHVSLASLHQQQGALDEAAIYYRRALSLQADHAEANYNFGVLLEAQGQWDEAAARHRQALGVKPDHARAHLHLCNLTVLQALGELGPTNDTHALPIGATDAPEEDSVPRASGSPAGDIEQLRSFAILALTNCWGDQSNVRKLAVRLVYLTAGTAECVARAQAAWPNRLTIADLLDPAASTPFAMTRCCERSWNRPRSPRSGSNGS